MGEQRGQQICSRANWAECKLRVRRKPPLGGTRTGDTMKEFWLRVQRKKAIWRICAPLVLWAAIWCVAIRELPAPGHRHADAILRLRGCSIDTWRAAQCLAVAIRSSFLRIQTCAFAKNSCDARR